MAKKVVVFDPNGAVLAWMIPGTATESDLVKGFVQTLQKSVARGRVQVSVHLHAEGSSLGAIKNVRKWQVFQLRGKSCADVHFRLKPVGEKEKATLQGLFVKAFDGGSGSCEISFGNAFHSTEKKKGSSIRSRSPSASHADL